MTPETHITQLAEHFTAGRYDLMTGFFRFPLPVYLDGTLVVQERPRDLWTFFQSMHSRLAAAGLPKLKGQLVSVELPQGDRFRLWADWTGMGCDIRLPVMKTICFNRGTHTNHLTEMVRITMAKDKTLATLLRAA